MGNKEIREAINYQKERIAFFTRTIPYFDKINARKNPADDKYYQGRYFENVENCKQQITNCKNEIRDLEKSLKKNKIMEEPTNYGKSSIKITVENLYEIYKKKNQDYGNSFDKSCDQFGIVAAVVRISDKVNRYTNLTDKKNQVSDESIKDTLLDLVNYCVMAINWLEKEKDEIGLNRIQTIYKNLEMEAENCVFLNSQLIEEKGIEVHSSRINYYFSKLAKEANDGKIEESYEFIGYLLNIAVIALCSYNWYNLLKNNKDSRETNTVSSHDVLNKIFKQGEPNINDIVGAKPAPTKKNIIEEKECKVKNGSIIAKFGLTKEAANDLKSISNSLNEMGKILKSWENCQK